MATTPGSVYSLSSAGYVKTLRGAIPRDRPLGPTSKQAARAHQAEVVLNACGAWLCGPIINNFARSIAATKRFIFFENMCRFFLLLRALS
jgi:hypothetical protein